jgi:hypothetical protein
MQSVQQTFASLSIPADYQDFFQLTPQQQEKLVRKFATYYPNCDRVKWSCCNSQSKIHTDTTKVIAASCMYIRNHGVKINALAILGYEATPKKQVPVYTVPSASPSYRVPNPNPMPSSQTPVSTVPSDREKQLEKMLQDLQNKVTQLESTLQARRSPSVHTPQKKNSPLHPVPSPVVLQDPFEDSSDLKPKEDDSEKTLEEICKGATGNNLYSRNSTNKCRWPVTDRRTKTVHRCTKTANEQGDVCTQHASVVASL